MPAGNKGLASGGANVPVRQFFVHLNFVARLEFSVENPARTPSPEPLVASITPTLLTINDKTNEL